MRPLIALGFVATLVLLTVGCTAKEPLPEPGALGDTTCDFGIYWPPRDIEQVGPPTAKPLLKGTLTLDANAHSPGVTALQLVVVLTRPSEEADREYWNSQLAFSDIHWMEEVRVWDAEHKWLWPNLPYLLRLPGQERVERYGGMDPGKDVDNDFAAVLIRKYDAEGKVEFAETKDAPLVSAEWHPVEAGNIDLHSIVHAAASDEFLLHLGSEAQPARGQLKVWLIYADFLRARPPLTWPKAREFAGGILAYFEIHWETSPDGGCRGGVRQKTPQQSTGFNWASWVTRKTGSDRSEARVRLSDVDE